MPAYQRAQQPSGLWPRSCGGSRRRERGCTTAIARAQGAAAPDLARNSFQPIVIRCHSPMRDFALVSVQVRGASQPVQFYWCARGQDGVFEEAVALKLTLSLGSLRSRSVGKEPVVCPLFGLLSCRAGTTHAVLVATLTPAFSVHFVVLVSPSPFALLPSTPTLKVRVFSTTTTPPASPPTTPSTTPEAAAATRLLLCSLLSLRPALATSPRAHRFTCCVAECCPLW